MLFAFGTSENGKKNAVLRRLSAGLMLLLLMLLFVASGKSPQTGLEAGEVPEQTERETMDTGTEERIVISELMSSNKSTLADLEGNFGDWIELHYTGSTAIELEGYTLHCGKDKWVFPACSMEPGAYRIVFCDRGNRAEGEELHTSFAVSALGERLRLFGPNGTLKDTFPLTELEEDCSAVRDPASGEAVVTRWPTPGYENSEEGYEAFQRALAAGRTDLVISEVMVSGEENASPDGKNGDWVELYNPTDRELNLGEYSLSDQGKNRKRARLPDRTLAPGRTAVLFCTDEAGTEGDLPFGLNAQKEELYLSRSDGRLCDYACLRDIPRGCSYGRSGEEGWFYFRSPTPGRENGPGARFTGETPKLIGEDGIFNGVETVTAELSGKGTIRYTTDGSEPNESSREYTEPIVIDSTCAIRAASFRENHIRSEVLSLSYIINEEHSLPVVSLVCDPERMFAEPGGVYTTPQEEIEIPAAVMIYGIGGEKKNLWTDCGVRLHGATSKFVQEKKSLKLCFRGRYGGPLQGDLFGNGVTSFASILLRTAQEGDSSSYMRDALMHDAAKECFPELPIQDHRYVVLYINGQYWGLYNLREAHSEEHFATHSGIPPETVSQWKEKWPADSKAEEIYRFALSNRLSEQENYERVAETFDIDSIIAWLIIQDYSGNIDFNAPNMRFYWSEEDRKLHYALADLDLGFFTPGNLPNLTTRGYYAYNRLAGALWKNEGFREAFCTKLNEALSGPLSDEMMLARIDRFADEIRPEIAREKARWGGRTADWEYLIDCLRSFVTGKHGQARDMVRLLRSSGALSRAETEQYLADFVK